MRSKKWHRCPHCGELNRGEASPDSICGNPKCGRQTWAPCPACEEQLVGRQVRCPHCAEHLAWKNIHPVLRDRADTWPLDVETDACDVDYALDHPDPGTIASLVDKQQERIEAIRARGKTVRPSFVLRGVTELSSDLARSLAKCTSVVHLPDVVRINPEAAGALVQGTKRPLCLDGLEEISPGVAKTLASNSLHLSLCGLTTLDGESARGLAWSSSKLSLNGLRWLSDGAAKVLAISQAELRLDLLDETTIPAVLKVRMYCRELCDFIDTWNRLSPTEARLIGEFFQGSFLSLNGITSLDPETARELVSQERGRTLSLNGLEEIPEPLARVLGGHQGGLLLSGLRRISAESLQALCRSPKHISLRGLKRLPVEGLVSTGTPQCEMRIYQASRMSTPQAERLAAFRGKLHFDTGSFLTPDIVRVLSRGTATIEILASETLSSEVAAELVASPSPKIMVRQESELQREMKHVREKAVREIEVPNIVLEKTTSLSPQDIESLGAWSGTLHLKQQVSLTVDVARRMSRCACNFLFIGQHDVAADVMTALIPHAATIKFYHEHLRLSDEVCRVIAENKLQGEMHFYRVFVPLTDEQVSILQQNPRVCLIN